MDSLKKVQKLFKVDTLAVFSYTLNKLSNHIFKNKRTVLLQELVRLNDLIHCSQLPICQFSANLKRNVHSTAKPGPSLCCRDDTVLERISKREQKISRQTSCRFVITRP